MTEGGREDDKESLEPLAEHRPRGLGLQLKLERGLDEGVYWVHVAYDELADRIGVAAARRKAMEYGLQLRGQMPGTQGNGAEGMEDGLAMASRGKKPEREYCFVSFPVTPDHGSWCDAAMRQRFRVAWVRTEQHWDQRLAELTEQRRRRLRDRFRQRLDALLTGEVYRHVDAVTKGRLLAEVTQLAFPERGREP